VLTDGGYQSLTWTRQIPGNSLEYSNTVRAKHETAHGHLKAFSVLASPFQHSLEKQSSSFAAAVNIVQIGLVGDRNLFEIDP